MDDAKEITAVLDFWFGESAKPFWFVKSTAFDQEVAARLGPLHEAAARGDCDAWMGSADGCLALCVLLDQVPRNIFRGTPRSFATDPPARAVARHAVDQGYDLATPLDRRAFFYLPFEHHEDMGSQDRSVALFTERVGDALTVEYAHRHRDVIARFGRFPHRNAILGRPSTAEETAFLQGPNSSF